MLVIDIREETELLDVHLESENPLIDIINIPERNIFANVDYINKLSEKYSLIYLICKTGERSDGVKKRYFSTSSAIRSYQGGWKDLELRKEKIKIDVIHNYSLLNMGPQQYMQFIIVLFLISMIGMNIWNISIIYINLCLALMAGFILFQVFTKSCLVTSVIPLSRNKFLKTSVQKKTSC